MKSRPTKMTTTDDGNEIVNIESKERKLESSEARRLRMVMLTLYAMGTITGEIIFRIEKVYNGHDEINASTWYSSRLIAGEKLLADVRVAVWFVAWVSVKAAVKTEKNKQRAASSGCRSIIQDYKKIYKAVDNLDDKISSAPITPTDKIAVCKRLLKFSHPDVVGHREFAQLKLTSPLRLASYLFGVQQWITLAFSSEDTQQYQTYMFDHKLLVERLGTVVDGGISWTDFYAKLLATNITVPMLRSWLPPGALLPELMEIVLSYDVMDGERLCDLGPGGANDVVYQRLGNLWFP